MEFLKIRKIPNILKTFFLFFDSTGVGTQGLVLDRQALSLDPSPQPFSLQVLFCFVFNRVLLLCPGKLGPPSFY
jgi:hypothetical protein